MRSVAGFEVTIMSDDSKQLTSKQQELFVDWVNSKAKNHQCPVCGENNWRVGEHIIHALAQEPLQAGKVYPQVFLSCNNCAFIRYFMAKTIGLFDMEEGNVESEVEEVSDG